MGCVPVLTLCALTLAGPVATGTPTTHAQDAPAAGEAAERRTVSTIERSLLDAGLENVTVEPGKGLQIAYENRRYRHSAQALGHVRAAAGEPVLVGERRLGLVAAALQPLELGDRDEFKVLYPSDAWFPATPAGAFRSPTFRRMDLDLGVRVDYRVGQLFDPFQARFELEPRARLNPWPGAHVRAGIVLPLQNDFEVSPAAPDMDRVRPGRISLDQFAWIPGVSLVSVSGGYFGENRYGFSAGVARPFAQGAWLLDAQIDRTGFLAFTGEGTLYSEMERTSGFAGATWRPGFADVAVRVRGAQFLYGDHGVDLEVKRTLGDLDVGYFVQHTADDDVVGVRLDIPVPPLTRTSGTALRVQPAPRFQLDFHDQGAPIGTFLAGVASREDFLRQLNRPSLEANAARFRRAAEGSAPPAASPESWVSFSGMTGFIQTPWSGVLADRRVDIGYDWIPRKWAYDRRGQNDNQIFYATLGFLPRVETAIRWTRFPGYRSFEELVPESRLVDMDRMASVRVALLEPRPSRPGLAIGIDDAVGAGRFHSSYAVAGVPWTLGRVPTRWSLGYGSRLVKAKGRYVLDGVFGAGEAAPTPWSRLQLEYDSEKWNAGLGLGPRWGLQVRTALLHLESLAVGASWTHPL
jgi:hypothetical protein